MNASLHELACTGPTPDRGCVCERGRQATLDRFMDASEMHRERTESLVRGMEVLARKFAACEVVPLDVLDRMERVIVQLHAANVLRVSRASDAALLEGER